MSNADLHLNDTQYAAIGRFAAAWSFFETEMDFTISALRAVLEDDQPMPTTFKQRIKRWRDLSSRLLTDNSEKKSLTDIIDQAVRIQNDRCFVLHGRLYGDPDGQSDIVQIDNHRHLEEWTVTREGTNAQQLNEVSEMIKVLSEELLAFNEKHLPTSPNTLHRKFGGPLHSQEHILLE